MLHIIFVIAAVIIGQSNWLTFRPFSVHAFCLLQIHLLRLWSHSLVIPWGHSIAKHFTTFSFHESHFTTFSTAKRYLNKNDFSFLCRFFRYTMRLCKNQTRSLKCGISKFLSEWSSRLVAWINVFYPNRHTWHIVMCLCWDNNIVTGSSRR